MAADQESWVRANRNLVADDKARKDKFAISSVDPDRQVGVGADVQHRGLCAEPRLRPRVLEGLLELEPVELPSVVLMDFVGIINRGDKKLTDMSGEVRALIMAVNLGLASRNCWVGGGGLE
ncbi:hypothetical protein MCOR02_012323 [Pyricularia oryzae]|nr:hypothetical protein MCOR02_012323 [Pyricularia oryzae]